MSKRYRPNVWYQVGGDMNPADYGGTIAREYVYTGPLSASLPKHVYVEVLHIQPVVEYVGEDEACEVGFPFWTKEACYDLGDLQGFLASHPEANIDGLFDLSTRGARLHVAAEAVQYGYRTDEGPCGFSRDILGGRRVSWWSKGGFGGAQADAEFRRMMKEHKKR